MGEPQDTLPIGQKFTVKCKTCGKITAFKV